MGKAMAASDGNLRGKDVVINLRAEQGQRELIDRAAKVLGKNRSDFMIESALRAAETVLLDRVFFDLDEASYARFVEALESPPAVNARLLATLTAEAPWE
ncbi:DUF1778 domain-containing protein [Gloeobacter violaceus]|nr:DUF1778 domain-containing protein [Gloeobacter violaceus]